MAWLGLVWLGLARLRINKVRILCEPSTEFRDTKTLTDSPSELYLIVEPLGHCTLEHDSPLKTAIIHQGETSAELAIGDVVHPMKPYISDDYDVVASLALVPSLFVLFAEHALLQKIGGEAGYPARLNTYHSQGG